MEGERLVTWFPERMRNRQFSGWEGSGVGCVWWWWWREDLKAGVLV